MTVKITKPAINLREILSGIEPNATADQTPAEIKTAYESNSDTNAFTDSDKTKLDGIEQNATADQTGAEIKAAYEGEADTNAFTDTLLNKLNGIEANADVTDATNVEAAGAVMDAELTNEAAVKSVNQALTTTSDVTFNQVTADLVGNYIISGLDPLSALDLDTTNDLVAIFDASATQTKKIAVGDVMVGAGGRRNLIINGAMKVSQRGAIIDGGTGIGSYGLDRFVFEGTDYPITTQVAHRHSQITDGNRNALKISTTGTAIGSAQVHQRIERETFRHTIGQTVTFSCLVKRNSSNVTGGILRMIASVNINNTGYPLRDTPGIYPSHTVVETFVSGVQNIPADYTRYTAPFTMPAGANTTDILEIGLSFMGFTGAGTTEDIFSISEMQLEAGSVATPFEHRSYGEELALCQRYYWKSTNTYLSSSWGGFYSATAGRVWTRFPTTMRVNPSISTSNLDFDTIGTGAASATSISGIDVAKEGASFNGIGFPVNTIGRPLAYVGTVTADAEL